LCFRLSLPSLSVHDGASLNTFIGLSTRITEFIKIYLYANAIFSGAAAKNFYHSRNHGAR
jgi:hypothetical protein